MGRIWLPPQSDPWLALREPALLVPNRLPIGNAVLRADGLARGITACLVAEGGSLRDIVANVSPSVDAASGERVILGKVGPEYSGGSGVNTRFANEARFAPIGGSGFTVVAWFDVDTLTNYSAIAAFQQTTTTDGWELRLGGAGGLTGSDINFAQFNGVGVRAWRSGANRYSAGQRQAFLACSRDGQQIQTAPLIHWGTGSAVASANVGGAVGDMTVPASRELYVGHRYDNVTRLDGAVGMLLIYNRALSVAELDSLYARGPAALFEPAANEPIFIGTAGGATGTTVTLNSDSLAITDGTLTVTAQEDTTVSLTADTLSITDGSLSVQADVDTNVSLAGDTLTITDGSLGVTVGSNVEISLTPDTITITDGTLAISAAVDTVVTMVGDTLAISEGTLSVQADVDTTVTLNSGAITITDASLGVNVVRTVNLVPDSITITDGTLGVTAVQNTVVDLAAAALTITNGNLGVVSSTTITLEMVYNKLVEIEALLANRAGPIGAEENVIIQTDYATVGLYFDGSNYQVI